MNNEEKILTLLESMDGRLGKLETNMDNMNARLDKVDARMDGMQADINGINTRLDKIESDVSTLKDDVARNGVTIENDILPQLRLLGEDQEAIMESMATRGQIDQLREDLDIQKLKIEVLATKK